MTATAVRRVTGAAIERKLGIVDLGNLPGSVRAGIPTNAGDRNLVSSYQPMRCRRDRNRSIRRIGCAGDVMFVMDSDLVGNGESNGVITIVRNGERKCLFGSCRYRLTVGCGNLPLEGA